MISNFQFGRWLAVWGSGSIPVWVLWVSDLSHGVSDEIWTGVKNQFSFFLFEVSELTDSRVNETLVCTLSCSSVIDVLGLQDSKQSVAAVEKLSGGLSALSDIYVVSTFRLPAKLGGVLLGIYSKQDNRKYLEVAIMGKINKGWWMCSSSPSSDSSSDPNTIQILFILNFAGNLKLSTDPKSVRMDFVEMKQQSCKSFPWKHEGCGSNTSLRGNTSPRGST